MNCGKRDKYGSDLRSIENYLSSSEIRPEKKSEYLHKVSDTCLYLYQGNFLKLLIYNTFEAGINESYAFRMLYCDYYKNS